MRKTSCRRSDQLITVDVNGLAGMLSCGVDSAKKIGEEAEARVCVGRRVLYSVEKVKKYIEKIAF